MNAAEQQIHAVFLSAAAIAEHCARNVPIGASPQGGLLFSRTVMADLIAVRDGDESAPGFQDALDRVSNLALQIMAVDRCLPIVTDPPEGGLH